MADLRWDETAGRFRDASGRFLSERSVRAVVDLIADHASDRLAASAQTMLDGTKSLATFQAEAMATIKQSQLASVVIAHGGAEQMTFSRYGAAGNDIKAQYQYLRAFAQQVASGEQPLNGSLTARARQYGQVARVGFERAYGRDQQDRGYRACRNVLHAGESCRQCREQTARGWVEMGSLVPVGQRICRGNCRCSVTYRMEAAPAQADAA